MRCETLTTGGVVERHGSRELLRGRRGAAQRERGRARPRRWSATAARADRAAPPFRFSRMGPNGRGRQLAARACARSSASRWRAGGGGASQIPAGFTYLGQFVDHDLTFDKTERDARRRVSPAQLLQARSPSLDLDSLYGAGPQDPESAKFYEADGVHLKIGRTVAVGGEQSDGRLRPAARRRQKRRRETQGRDPRPAQRREPRRRADAPRLHPLPQPRRRHAAEIGAAGAALRDRRARS